MRPLALVPKGLRAVSNLEIAGRLSLAITLVGGAALLIGLALVRLHG